MQDRRCVEDRSQKTGRPSPNINARSMRQTWVPQVEGFHASTKSAQAKRQATWGPINRTVSTNLSSYRRPTTTIIIRTAVASSTLLLGVEPRNCGIIRGSWVELKANKIPCICMHLVQNSSEISGGIVQMDTTTAHLVDLVHFC